VATRKRQKEHAATRSLNAIGDSAPPTGHSAVIGHDSRGLPHPATAAPSPQGATILVFTAQVEHVVDVAMGTAAG